ncbi:PA2169 family four-helix-bundle protein [Constantimarinum furrinae]|uniref:DUF2383 domain-containing protein n=1 Tax=Constantimarinum furrinae TaxID=2562285 RepID=A0A7G8PQX9_9FLAO|nr:PA2169 family four-helix-bundle protein [Constantimarinum furrinae]QNJ96745.1 hypothetical protein ALE3EI_0155 [Constantimarinum furrinae]
MNKKYADFNKLNRLLVASFEAEKLYYNAAQDAQTTALKRFLNYMAVERNRMSHDISNELHSRDIEPLKEDADKGNIDRTWHEIKEALEHFDAEVILNQCIARDRNNIKRYTDLIEAKQLPEAIIAMLEKQRKQLEWYIKQAEQHKIDPFKKETAPKAEDEKKTSDKNNDDRDHRVIPLRAM